MSATKDDVQSVYRNWAREYDENPELNPSFVMERNSLFALLKVSERDTILEVGCGTGRLTRPIARKCQKIVAVDFSDSVLEVAMSKSEEFSNIEFQRLDVRKRLPFESSSFDKAIAPLILNHIRDIRPLFKEINRVLKPGGSFVFDDVIPDSTYFKQKLENQLGRAYNQGKQVFYAHSIDDYVHALHRTGFQIEQMIFPRFDSSIKETLTKATYERNKGHTFGIIVRATKQEVS